MLMRSGSPFGTASRCLTKTREAAREADRKAGTGTEGPDPAAGSGAEARRTEPVQSHGEEQPSVEVGGDSGSSQAVGAGGTATQKLTLSDTTEIVPRAKLFTLPKPEERTSDEAVGTEEEGSSAPLHELAMRLRIDDVIVALEERRGSLPTQDLLRCRLDGIVVEEVESFFERLTGKIPAEAMRPSYLIFNKGFVQHPLAQVAKRCVDITMALIGIALTWPLMLMTAIMVRLDSPGPILFKQVRSGQLRKDFTLCKFRSMRADAEKHTGPVWASKDDPRITRVGKFIRKTRLDELPQLFNVLAGSMSLVGPRPERPNFVEDLAEKIPYFHQRHIVKPGVTGWAQINYPYGNTVEDALQKLQYDLFYIKYQSILFDLSIVFNTLKTVILRKGT